MSWADDIRCLYCDGRLPLYRKITNGQFCSGAHRKAYWQEHERLAVERLHQTHDSLRAYRPPGAVEAILGVAAADEEASLPSFEVAQKVYQAAQQFEENPPAIAGFLHPPVWAMPQWLPDYVAAIDVAPLDSAKMLRWPEVVRELRRYGVECASWVPLILPAADGGFRLAAAVQPIPPDPRGSHPVIDLRLNYAPQESAPRADELMVIASEPIPGLAGVIAIVLPGPRDYSHSAILEELNAGSVLRVQLPLQAVRMRATLGCAALLYAGLKPLPATALTLRGALGEEGPRALDLRIESSRLELSTPPFRPRLNLACGSRYKVQTRQIAAAPSSAEPAGFAAMPPRISLPQISLAQVSLTKSKAHAIAAASGAAPVSDPGKAFSPALIVTDAPVEKPAARPVFHPDFEPSPSGLLPLAGAAQQPESGIPVRSAPAAVLIPQPPRAEPSRPVSHLTPLDQKPTSDAIAAARPMEPPVPVAPKAHLWTHAIDFWNRAPRDLKILAFALPVLLGLTLHPSLPKVRATAPAAATGVEKNLEHAFNTQWANVRQTMVDRAAVALNEDFRAGLDDWASRDDATAAWSFDATGFVRPGPLALYRPSMELTDYQVQFLGMIDKQALSWVARAADFDNFYVIKLNILKSGPLPTVGVTRYAVVKGVADARVDTIAPIDARADMLYRVRLDVRGDDFALSVQGQMVDSWSEPRLRHGGIGFFSARGEQSRLRWVQVTHQYDMLGRLCAYLAPYNIPNTGENFE